MHFLKGRKLLLLNTALFTSSVLFYLSSGSSNEQGEETRRVQSIPLNLNTNSNTGKNTASRVKRQDRLIDMEGVNKGKLRLIQLRNVGVTHKEDIDIEEKNEKEVITINEPLPVPVMYEQKEEVFAALQAPEVISAQEVLTQMPEKAEIIISVGRGDSISRIFSRAGLGQREAYNTNKVLTRSKGGLIIHPGDTFNFKINEKGGLESFVLTTIDLQNVTVRLIDGKYKVKKEMVEPDIRITSNMGTIKSSLFLDAKKSGMNESMIMELADIFKWDIDFSLDLKKNDKFFVIYEEKFVNGDKIGTGEILAARFNNSGRVFEAIRHENSTGKVAYYTSGGRSLSKAFLRSPVDFRRISSSFTKERYHPVLGVKRPHNGVDYAASTGTPIKASGSGKVIFRSTKGGYGNTIIIKHNNGIKTLYAHQSKFAGKIKKGSYVKQGQTIGYVGMSGLATGPHLHYEFIINGAHRDPVKVKLPNDVPLDDSEIKGFKVFSNNMIAELNKLS